jgi:hypothetical protein
MIRLLRGVVRFTARLILGTVIGTLGLVLTGLARVIAVAAVLVLLARARGV